MMKPTGTDDPAIRRRPRPKGPAEQARALQEATARLGARRQRDALPLRLETPRLVLRAPIRGDVPELVRLADNRTIAERLARLPHPYTRADGIAFVEIFSQRDDERPYAITLEDRFAGVVGFSFAAGEPPELGYWLGEPYWGRGIMSEAVKALLEAAFATGLFPVIKARALKTNLASRHVLEKAGFVFLREDLEAIGNRAGEATVCYRLEMPKWS